MPKQEKVRANIRILPVKGVSQTINYLLEDRDELEWLVAVGKNCVIERAIIDKNARIGDGSVIRNAEGVVEAEGPGYSIHDGIVIVAKNVVLPPGTKI